jgi:hypothetical protein
MAGGTAVTAGWAAVGQGALGIVFGIATIADSLSLSTGAGSGSSGPQGTPPAKGGENAAAARGRAAHREFAEGVKARPGWQSEPRLVDPTTGKTVVPDAVTPRGHPVELKPNTPSGRASGERQLLKYERATGKKGRVIYYDP